jgi:hypothetical protein
MPRGGKREGCGRKRHSPSEVKESLTLTISPSVITRLEAQAIAEKMSVSLLVEKISKEYLNGV